MQEITRDDYNLLNGAAANAGCNNNNLTYDNEDHPAHLNVAKNILEHKEEDMCVSLTLPCHIVECSKNNSTPSALKLASIALESNAIKLEEHVEEQVLEHEVAAETTINDIDLFPTHASTWQQHPMNSQEHAHHRLQHQQQQQQQHQQHRQLRAQPTHHQQQHHHTHLLHHYDAIGVGGSANNSKLLLQSSDDPLICRGANEDDNPFELNSLMAAVSNDRCQQHHHQQQQQQQQQQPPHQLEQQQQQQSELVVKRPQNGCCSSLTKQQLKMKAGLMSAAQQQQHQLPKAANENAVATSNKRPTKPKAKRNGVLKLRFHHQALPPEYLSHYEATQGQYAQQQQQQKQQSQSKESATQEQQQQQHQHKLHSPKLCQTTKLPPSKSSNSHENVRSWLQKIAEIQRTAEQQQQKQRSSAQRVQLKQAAAVADQHYDVNNNRISAPATTKAATSHTATPTLAHKPVKHEDISNSSNNYNNVKLKLLTAGHHSDRAAANIQHSLPSLLPAPNAGTAVVTTTTSNSGNISNRRVMHYADLPYMGEITLHTKPRRGRKPKKADICHLIYKNYGTIIPQQAAASLNSVGSNNLRTSHTRSATAHISRRRRHQHHQPLHQHSRSLEMVAIVGPKDEPLNLCVRDQRMELSSASSSCGEGDEEDEVDDDNKEDDDVISSSTSTSGSASTPVPTTSTDRLTDSLLAENLRSSMSHLDSSPATKNTTIIVNGLPETAPLQSFYQKLIESSTLLQPNGTRLTGPLLPIETIEKDNQIALKIPIPSGLLLMPKNEKISPVPTISPSAPLGPLEYPEPLSTPSSIKSENSTLSVNPQHQQQQQAVTPQKRKRSAIFIPPIPAESNATEVSICKFKFTGGLKPSLQEKKMLSVDSDGNYRYYSGTGGDKNMRCEFFPRESLQQSSGVVLPGASVPSPSSFLNSTEKISIDIPPPSAGLSNELLQLPESPTSTLLLPPPVVSPTSPKCYNNAANPATAATFQLSVPHVQREHKKKSRRSSQREKLEKTFKENGFLIQTQQLESAEGATYCKFRQLKKFTRYLFRNWKDYLPDELKAKAAAAAAAAISNGNATPEDAVALENLLASHGFTQHLQHTEDVRQQQEQQLQLDKNTVVR